MVMNHIQMYEHNTEKKNKWEREELSRPDQSPKVAPVLKYDVCVYHHHS